MAQGTITEDGNLSVALDDVEKETVAMLTVGALSEYITLWLAERRPRVMSEKFSQLSGEDRAAVLEKLSNARQPGRGNRP